MNTITPDRRQQDWESLQDEQGQRLPTRPRRRLLDPRTATLGALILCAIGFYAGVRVEKAQLPASSSTTTTAGSGAAAGGTGRSRLAGLFGAAGGAGAIGTRGAGASVGTVSSVSGRTIYLTETSGNTVKVTLSSITRITKTQVAKRAAIHPGDTLVVTGVTSAAGALSAASVADSGAARSFGGFGSASGAAASGGTGASGSGSGSSGSGVGSLFSSGG
jgi:hypothetical protein